MIENGKGKGCAREGLGLVAHLMSAVLFATYIRLANRPQFQEVNGKLMEIALKIQSATEVK